MKNLDKYKIDEQIEYYIQIGNIKVWRKAKVVDSRIVYPENGSHHRPYTMILVEVIRTYFNALLPENERYYDKLNTEWVVYANEVRNFN